MKFLRGLSFIISLLANPICIMTIGGIFASSFNWMQLGSQMAITNAGPIEAVIYFFLFIIMPIGFMIVFGIGGVAIGSIISILASILPLFSPNMTISKIAKFNIIFNSIAFVILLIVVLLL